MKLSWTGEGIVLATRAGEDPLASLGEELCFGEGLSVSSSGFLFVLLGVRVSINRSAATEAAVMSRRFGGGEMELLRDGPFRF